MRDSTIKSSTIKSVILDNTVHLGFGIDTLTNTLKIPIIPVEFEAKPAGAEKVSLTGLDADGVALFVRQPSSQPASAPHIVSAAHAAGTGLIPTHTAASAKTQPTHDTAAKPSDKAKAKTITEFRREINFNHQVFTSLIELQSSISGSIGIPIHKAIEITAEISSSSGESNNDIFVLLKLDCIEKTVSIADHYELTHEMEKEIDSGISFADIRKKYGDAIVSRITYGRSAILVIRFYLTSSHEKESFKLALKTVKPIEVGGSISADYLKLFKGKSYKVYRYVTGMSDASAGIFKTEDDISGLVSKVAIDDKTPIEPVPIDYEHCPFFSAETTEQVRERCLKFESMVSRARKYYKFANKFIDIIDNYLHRLYALDDNWIKVNWFLLDSDPRMRAIIKFNALQETFDELADNIYNNACNPEALETYKEQLALLQEKVIKIVNIFPREILLPLRRIPHTEISSEKHKNSPYEFNLKPPTEATKYKFIVKTHTEENDIARKLAVDGLLEGSEKLELAVKSLSGYLNRDWYQYAKFIFRRNEATDKLNRALVIFAILKRQTDERRKSRANLTPPQSMPTPAQSAPTSPQPNFVSTTFASLRRRIQQLFTSNAITTPPQSTLTPPQPSEDDWFGKLSAAIDKVYEANNSFNTLNRLSSAIESIRIYPDINIEAISFINDTIKDTFNMPSINYSAEYDDHDITAILAAYVRKYDGRFNGFKIHAMEAVNALEHGQLKQRLDEDKNTHPHKRIVLIPCNIGNNHWVGLLFEFNERNECARAEFIDSTHSATPETLTQQLKEAYPGKEFSIQYQRIRHDGGTNYGACTIENLELRVQRRAPTDVSIARIREKHLDYLRGDTIQFIRDFLTTVADKIDRHVAHVKKTLDQITSSLDAIIARLDHSSMTMPDALNLMAKYSASIPKSYKEIQDELNSNSNPSPDMIANARKELIKLKNSVDFMINNLRTDYNEFAAHYRSLREIISQPNCTLNGETFFKTFILFKIIVSSRSSFAKLRKTLESTIKRNPDPTEQYFANRKNAINVFRETELILCELETFKDPLLSDITKIMLSPLINQTRTRLTECKEYIKRELEVRPTIDNTIQPPPPLKIKQHVPVHSSCCGCSGSISTCCGDCASSTAKVSCADTSCCCDFSGFPSCCGGTAIHRVDIITNLKTDKDQELPIGYDNFSSMYVKPMRDRRTWSSTLLFKYYNDSFHDKETGEGYDVGIFARCTNVEPPVVVASIPDIGFEEAESDLDS